MITVTMAVLLRASPMRVLDVTHQGTHAFSAQRWRSPICLWLWWLLAGMSKDRVTISEPAQEDDDTNPQI